MRRGTIEKPSMEIEKVIRILTLFIALLCLLVVVAQIVFFNARPLRGTLPIWIIAIALIYSGRRCETKSGRHTTD